MENRTKFYSPAKKFKNLQEGHREKCNSVSPPDDDNNDRWERREKQFTDSVCISFSHSLSFSLVRENALPSSMTSSTTITFSLVTKLFKILSNGVGRFWPNAFVVICSAPSPRSRNSSHHFTRWVREREPALYEWEDQTGKEFRNQDRLVQRIR